MTINLMDKGCEVAEEDMSAEINSVTWKVIPRQTLTSNINSTDSTCSPFEIYPKSQNSPTKFDFEVAKQKFEV